MFSRTVEYALRAIVQLAYMAPQGATTGQISVATKVPEPYLRKVLQALRRAELVTSQRGASGGVRLNRDAEELTILDVVNAVDPIERIDRCPLDLKSHGVRLCPLHARMDRALQGIEQAFRETTLAEILAEPTLSTPLCETPDEHVSCTRDVTSP
ncbi:MAG: transcriptional regulator [Planctomycetaceae bacterium]|nr:transcriptional regulator [Planctomycetaceae bacterium]